MAKKYPGSRRARARPEPEKEKMGLKGYLLILAAIFIVVLFIVQSLSPFF